MENENIEAVVEEAVVAADTQNEDASEARAERAQRPQNKANNNHRRKKVCAFCAENIDYIDYKDTTRLRKYVSERAKILPRRVSGTCAKHQRQLTLAIKRARHAALMPYISD